MKAKSMMPHVDLDSRYLMLMSYRFMGRVVEFLSGKGKERFFIHEKLIRASSPFFDKVMSATCLKSMQHTGTIQLPEDEPEIFGVYVH